MCLSSHTGTILTGYAIFSPARVKSRRVQLISVAAGMPARAVGATAKGNAGGTNRPACEGVVE
jgi:hypothetical protein